MASLAPRDGHVNGRLAVGFQFWDMSSLKVCNVSAYRRFKFMCHLRSEAHQGRRSLKAIIVKCWMLLLALTRNTVCANHYVGLQFTFHRTIYQQPSYVDQ